VIGVPPYAGPQRVLRAVLFADFAGFSRLSEAALPLFWTRVMGHIGEVVRRHAAVVEASNTWGDALFAVIDGAHAAATIALEIVDRLRSAEIGDGAGGMRIGVHYGPMYVDTDPVTARRTFYGTEVTLAARIEPRVPPGQVYLTEAMAAALAMHPGDALVCRYVGRIDLAKDYGILSAYRLERR
jgi:adenylate cyclase